MSKKETKGDDNPHNELLPPNEQLAVFIAGEMRAAALGGMNMMKCRERIRVFWNCLSKEDKIAQGPIIRSKTNDIKLVAEAMAQEFKVITLSDPSIRE